MLHSLRLRSGTPDRAARLDGLRLQARSEIPAIGRRSRCVAQSEQAFQKGRLFIPFVRADPVCHGQRPDDGCSTGQQLPAVIKDRGGRFGSQVNILIFAVGDRDCIPYSV